MSVVLLVKKWVVLTAVMSVERLVVTTVERWVVK